MPTLCELAELYGSDKLSAHSYIEHFYPALFEGREVRALLEVGIGFEDLMKPFVPHFVQGSSLRMWTDYLPSALIFACDIRPDALVNEGRIRSWVADQSNPRSLERLLASIREECGVEQFDVVIDDGSHQTSHQIVTWRVLGPHVAPGGVYVIEDVREPEVVARATGGTIHRWGKRPDDCIVEVRR